MNADTPLALKAVLAVLVVVCTLLVASAVFRAMSGSYRPLLFAALWWGPLAWGLWKLHPVARRVSVALLWIVVVVLPIGLINPFAAVDRVVSGSLWEVALPIYSAVAAALYCIHILAKYKQEFHRGGT